MSITTYRGIRPSLGARVFIDPSAVVIGQVTIGDDSSVWPTAVLRGDVNTIATRQVTLEYTSANSTTDGVVFVAPV